MFVTVEDSVVGDGIHDKSLIDDLPVEDDLRCNEYIIICPGSIESDHGDRVVAIERSGECSRVFRNDISDIGSDDVGQHDADRECGTGVSQVVAIQLRLDRTFGDGPITIEIRGAFIVPQVSALQPDGDIVVACIGSGSGTVDGVSFTLEHSRPLLTVVDQSLNGQGCCYPLLAHGQSPLDEVDVVVTGCQSGRYDIERRGICCIGCISACEHQRSEKVADVITVSESVVGGGVDRHCIGVHHILVIGSDGECPLGDGERTADERNTVVALRLVTGHGHRICSHILSCVTCDIECDELGICRSVDAHGERCGIGISVHLRLSGNQ